MHSKMKTVAIVTLLSVPFLAGADTPLDVNALKAQGAVPLLQALDKRHNGYPTQVWEFKMTIKPTSGASRSVEFKVWQKATRRLVRFTAPGTVKGMSVLSRGDTMYVYSPQTDNVRRVAAHARRQTLLGSDFTYDDMAQVDWAPIYDASFAEDKGGFLWMELKKKDGVDATWAKLRLRINKKQAMVDRIEYFDGGKKVKEQIREEWAVLDGAPTYKKITVRDVATGHATTLEMKSQKIGEKLSNKMFSKRSLVRGN